jgi:predicted GIY-YIG superfamily endonuclease
VAGVPDTEGRLFAHEIAARAGITKSDWRARVSRHHAPSAIGYVQVRGAIRAVWDPEQIAEYLAARRERLARRDSRPTDVL